MAIKNVKVGLAVGRGTGPELARVFKRVIHELATYYSVHVDILESSRLYHSYFSLEEHFSSDPQSVSEQSHRDVEHYLDFCRTLVGSQRCDVVFRTAMNAQSLYLVRQELEAVKVESFREAAASADAADNRLLVVRDQAQGFYAGRNEHDVARGTVARDTVFSKAVMARLLDYSLERARQAYGADADGKPPVDEVLLVYKFHLFDGVLSAWAAEWSAQRGGIPVRFVQPDTANRNLLAFGLGGGAGGKRQLILAGNEWGDIMHVVLLHLFGGAAQEERCTENVYLHPDVAGLVEYQTVHGSADDIAGRNVVNPSATIRAAAAILEHKAGCAGVVERMERALLALEKASVGTGDQKRKKSISTDDMTYLALKGFAANVDVA